MKTSLLFLALALASVLPLQAQNFLQNGDFADGADHWYGDGRTPADMGGDDPTATPNPLYAKGLIIPLKGAAWSKVSQDFKGNIAAGVLTIAYQVSPDFNLSTKPEDYQNVPELINDEGWKPFNGAPGEWIIFISDFGTDRAHGTYYKIKVNSGTGPQVIKAKVKGLTPLEDKTLAIAFPPGTGAIVLLGVSLSVQ